MRMILWIILFIFLSKKNYALKSIFCNPYHNLITMDKVFLRIHRKHLDNLDRHLSKWKMKCRSWEDKKFRCQNVNIPHFHFCVMHVPSPHLKSSSLHRCFGQFNSSLPSPQSEMRKFHKMSAFNSECFAENVNICTHHRQHRNANATKSSKKWK